MNNFSTNEKNNGIFDENKANFISYMTERGYISEYSAKNYERIMHHTKKYEEELNKDLSNFTFSELERILFDFKANNRNTIESYARIISSYLNWGVYNNISEHNPLQDLKPDDFTKYLTNNEEYFTENQIRRWEDMLENYQDAVIIRLLFIGVGGKQLSEIRNLKKQDVDRDNKRLRLINTLTSDEDGNPIKFTERYIDVDNERVFDLIEGAIKSDKYIKRNGEIKDGNESRSIGFLELVDNDYVIRSSITKTDNYNFPVDKFVIYRRIGMISEVFGIEEFTTKLIQRSGMIKYAKDIVKNDTVTLDDLKIVADRFNIKSYHNLKGFLTIENIEKTYKSEEG